MTSAIIDSAPEQAQLGLRVNGTTYPAEDKKQGCADAQQDLPVGAMNAAPRADAKTCIADVTGGSHADALTADPGTPFRTAWTTYQATGTPIKGSINGCSDAPLIAPGQYLDGFTGGRDLYYKVKKRPDQQLQVSATAIAEEGYSRGSGLTVSAGPVGDGDPDDWLRQYAQSEGWTDIITAGARSNTGGTNEKPAAPEDTGCIMIGNRISDAGDMPLPIELLVGIADANTAKVGEQLPEPRPGVAADGGFSFNSATPIGPSTHRQSIVVGEAPFWRVDLKAGQQLTVKAGVDIPADYPGSITDGWTVQIYNATRNETTCNKDDTRLTKLFQRETGRFEWTCGPWQIARPEDADGFDPNGYAVPGTYYIQVQVAEPADKAKGLVVPIDLTVDVTGAPRPGDDPVFVFTSDAGAGQPTGGGPPQSPSGTDQKGAPLELPDESAAKDDGATLRKVALPVGITIAGLVLTAATLYGLREEKSPPNREGGV